MENSSQSDLSATNDVPSFPSTEETFRYPLIMRLVCWIGLVVFPALLLFSLFCMLWPAQGPPGWGNPVAACFFLAFTVLEILAIWFYESRVTIDPTKITSIWFGCRPISLDCHEIQYLCERAAQLDLPP